MLQDALREGKDTTVYQSIIDLYTMVNGNLDADNITNFISYNWETPTLLNSWVNFDANTYNTAGYMKDSLGFVHLKGLIKDGTATAGTDLFSLPTGYRPEKLEIHIVNSWNGSAYVQGDCRIKTTGEVEIQNGANTWFCLDGITFKAYQ